ncbi:MAG: leucine-rich repeat domain-containing protein [Candidatus Babeliales bacterium]
MITFLMVLSNQDFLKLFEALNFLDCKPPKEQDNQTEQDNQFEHQLIGPFIRKILTDQRQRRTGETIPDIANPKTSLIDYFFHPYHYDRFNQLTQSRLARTVFGEILCNGNSTNLSEKKLTPQAAIQLKNDTPRQFLQWLRQKRNTVNQNVTSGKLAKLDPLIPLRVMSSGKYSNYGFTHFPPDFASNPAYVQMISPFNSVNLPFNSLQCFPPPTKSLANLGSLDLSNNKVTSIPEGCGLPCLTELTLHTNQFKGPLNASALNQFPLLVTLSLSRNRISAIEGPLQLRNLSSLEIAENQLVSLPEILACKALGTIFIMYNPLQIQNIDGIKQWAELPLLESVHASNLSCFDLLSQKEKEKIRKPIRAAFTKKNKVIHF